MTPQQALDYAEAYMLRGERPAFDMAEVVRVLREAVAGGWVACSERMPNAGTADRVWFCVGTRVFRGEYRGEFVANNGCAWSVAEVTHWMPLTKPLTPPKAVPPTTTEET